MPSINDVLDIVLVISGYILVVLHMEGNFFA